MCCRSSLEVAEDGFTSVRVMVSCGPTDEAAAGIAVIDDPVVFAAVFEAGLRELEMDLLQVMSEGVGDGLELLSTIRARGAATIVAAGGDELRISNFVVG